MGGYYTWVREFLLHTTLQSLVLYPGPVLANWTKLDQLGLIKTGLLDIHINLVTGLVVQVQSKNNWTYKVANTDVLHLV